MFAEHQVFAPGVEDDPIARAARPAGSDARCRSRVGIETVGSASIASDAAAAANDALHRHVLNLQAQRARMPIGDCLAELDPTDAAPPARGRQTGDRA